MTQESQNVVEVPLDNAGELKSHEVTDNTTDENNQKIADNCDVQTNSVSEAAAHLDTQTNGVSAPDKEAIFVNLNHSVSQEFKNQVIECIEEVSITGVENSSGVEYMNVIEAETTEVTVKEDAEEKCIEAIVSSTNSQEPQETEDEIQLMVLTDDSSSFQNLDDTSKTEEETGDDDKDTQSANIESENAKQVDGEEFIKLEMKESADSVSVADSSATEVLLSESSGDATDVENQIVDSTEPLEKSFSKDKNQILDDEVTSMNLTDEMDKMQGEVQVVAADVDDAAEAEATVVSETTRNAVSETIRSIFDDWSDEPLEEEIIPREPDSVEQELQNLLQDDKFNESDEMMVFHDPVEQEIEIHSSVTEKTSTTACNKKQNASGNNSLVTMKGEATSTPKPKGRPPKNLGDKSNQKVGLKSTSKSRSEEALKERFKEKQKNLDAPGVVDVVFVNKITQRLSQKLSSMSTPSKPRKSSEGDSSSAPKENDCDRKELLSILEDDTDWSNLKPNVENKPQQESSNKLTPSLEREIALKQLLELPGNSTKKKRKSSKSNEEENKAKEEVKATKTGTPAKSKEDRKSTGEELRSGRKRKPTEKAREHEQSFTNKRQKMKNKALLKKGETTPEMETTQEDANSVSTNDESTPVKNKDDVQEKSPRKKQVTKASPEKDKSLKSKADASPLAKQKAVAKKGTPMKSSATPKKVGRPKSSATPVVEKNVENNEEKPKQKKKKLREIEKLLQDEGVVNILYDVEQTDTKRRLVPITKSQTKVMDMDKVEREWNQRKKMVRNAVINANLSEFSNAKPRPKRSLTLGADQKAKKSSDSSLTTKMVNMAEDSVIIRRHSTSSYSSAPGSPRNFVHEVVESEAADDESKSGETSSPKRSAKRKLSKDDSVAKKKRKITNEDFVECQDEIVDDAEEAATKKVEKGQMMSPVNSPKKGRKLLAKGQKKGSVKGEDTKNNDGAKKEIQDELSTVLAETATALSSENGAAQVGNNARTRPIRGKCRKLIKDLFRQIFLIEV